ISFIPYLFKRFQNFLPFPGRIERFTFYLLDYNLCFDKQVVYMAVVGSFPFNSFLSGVLSCIGTAVLAVCLRIQVNKDNKEFKDVAPERAFADFILCNLVLHLVIMNFLG
ncbi:unnamed protein product, partial [Linum tenue]